MLSLTSMRHKTQSLGRPIGTAYSCAVLDPRLLRVLHEVAQTGSFSAAGRVLGCSQPAVTQQIRALEKAVGAPVAVRIGRSMRLTDVGQLLARHSDDLVRSLRTAEEEARAFVDHRAGTVRLAGFPSACAALIPRAMGVLAERTPLLHVQLTTAEPPASITALRAGERHVAVCYDYAAQPGDDSGLQRHPLLSDRLLLLVPAEHHAGRSSPAQLAEFATDNWIAGSPQAADRLTLWTQRAGYEPRLSIFVDDYVAVQALVAAGRGVGVVPGLALQAHRHPAVRVLRLEELPLRRVYALCFPQMRAIPSVSATLEALGHEAGRLAAESDFIDIA